MTDKVVLTKRPSILNLWKEGKELVKEWAAFFKANNERVIEIVETGSYPDFKIVEKTEKNIDTERILEWLNDMYEQKLIDKKEYLSCFRREFDLPKFTDLLKLKPELKASRPKGIITKHTRKEVHLVKSRI